MRFILAFLFSLSPAIAQQGGGVVQIGAVTANNCVKWVSSNKITDAGATCGGGGGGSGTVTSVGQTFTGGLISVGGSPVTTSGTLALTVAGTSGGVPYFSGAATWASSATLTANALMIGGGAGAAPSTTTTGTGVLTALGSAVNGSGAISLTTSPVLVTPTLGVAAGTSLALGGATLGSNALAVTGTVNVSGATTVGGSLNVAGVQIDLTGGPIRGRSASFNIYAPSISVFGWGSGSNDNTGTNDTGFSRISAGTIGVGTGTQGSIAGGMQMATLAIGGATIGSNALAVTGSSLFGSAIITGPSSATFVHGAAANASPVANTLQIGESASTGGTNNLVGANGTIRPGNGVGSGGSGSLLFQVAAAGSSGNAADTYATALTIASSGNVGIGTTAPAYKLDVNGIGHFTGTVAIDSANPVQITLTDSSTSAPTWAFKSSSGRFIIAKVGVPDYFSILSNGNVGIGTTAPSQLLTLGSTGALGWDNGSGTADVILNRDAANTLALRNGVNAQTLNVYNTFTDASNYERGVFDWAGTANVLTIGTKAAGTGVARNLQFLVGGVNKLDYGVTTSSTWTFANKVAVPGAANPALTSTATWTSGAGSSAGTLTNAPSVGNPTSWIPINDNGTTRYIPAW